MLPRKILLRKKRLKRATFMTQEVIPDSQYTIYVG